MTADSLLLERAGLPDEFTLAGREISARGLAGPRQHPWHRQHVAAAARHVPRTRRHADQRHRRLSRGPADGAGVRARLNHFLGHLDGHHNVEDIHYFPVFAKAETRLTRGFEILDADHHTIHEGLERNAEAANAFIRTLRESEDKQRFAADAYADENSRLIAMLTRHLADEEDLIIPLILDRGDRALGVD
ncbi:hemerythrin domain-containing protein [Mesorhizobium muleiense]|uniref:hemerythrin domain-containing protein n=1 Tax=Mesorhizobium muleiense TaxID=1004279 RepID=UPI001F2A7C4C|nr:hemerythrin domain-containing protein [Mesorhizobium muleiense]MCF6111219.1 hemerythrin domain-containing protein [Mesorhizobium muleiense]